MKTYVLATSTPEQRREWLQDLKRRRIATATEFKLVEEFLEVVTETPAEQLEDETFRRLGLRLVREGAAADRAKSPGWVDRNPEWTAQARAMAGSDLDTIVDTILEGQQVLVDGAPSYYKDGAKKRSRKQLRRSIKAHLETAVYKGNLII
jgi:hypothetical protein